MAGQWISICAGVCSEILGSAPSRVLAKVFHLRELLNKQSPCREDATTNTRDAYAPQSIIRVIRGRLLSKIRILNILFILSEIRVIRGSSFL